MNEVEFLYELLDILDSENADLFHNVEEARSKIYQRIQFLEMERWQI
jgi:hypothetical protein